MTDRTWVGGGNNNANRANHWSPDGVPQPGDTLEMQVGTMNIRGNDLAGDALIINKPIGETAPNTLNLSRHANVSVEIPQFQTEDVTINAKGSDTLNLQTDYPSFGHFTVNLADHASVTGNVNMTFGGAVVNGGDGSRYLHNGSGLLGGSTVIFDTRVEGNGSFRVVNAQSFPGELEFGGPVSHGQYVEVEGEEARGVRAFVTLDQPDLFKGSVGLGVFGEVNLIGLTNADSFQLKNDILSIFSGCQVIDQLRLTTLTVPPNFAPDTEVRVYQTAAGVVVNRGLLFSPGTETLLPEHQLHG